MFLRVKVQNYWLFTCKSYMSQKDPRQDLVTRGTNTTLLLPPLLLQLLLLLSLLQVLLLLLLLRLLLLLPLKFSTSGNTQKCTSGSSSTSQKRIPTTNAHTPPMSIQICLAPKRPSSALQNLRFLTFWNSVVAVSLSHGRQNSITGQPQPSTSSI